MNILHLSGAMVWGGNENQLAHFVTNDSGFDLKQMVFCFDGSPIHHFCIDRKIPSYAVPKSGSFSGSTAKALKKCVEDHAIDIIHIHTSNFVSVYMVADILYNLRAKAVFSKKGISDASSVLSRLKYNYKGIDAYISVSEIVDRSFKKQLYKRNWGKMHVVYDGIPDRTSVPNTENEVSKVRKEGKFQYVIGSVANHTPAKDLKTMINVMDLLVNVHHRKEVICLQFGGYSGLTGELRELIRSKGLSDHMILLGYREDAAQSIPGFDAALITSQREGGPVFLLEAMRDEVPVVTTRVGVVGELLTHDKHALIAEVGAAEDLAENLLLLMKQPEKGVSITKEAKKRFLEKLTVKNTLEATVQIYREVLSKSRR